MIKSDPACLMCEYSYETHCDGLECSGCDIYNPEDKDLPCGCLRVQYDEECPYYTEKGNND